VWASVAARLITVPYLSSLSGENMTTQRILYAQENGVLAIVIPVPDCGLTIDQIAEKDVPEGVPFTIVDVADIPTDRTFRGAWEYAGNAVATNMTKAREIAHGIRRAARAKEFAPLDVEATIPARAAQAEAARQVIREKYEAMQAAIDAASTEQALKAALS